MANYSRSVGVYPRADHFVDHTKGYTPPCDWCHPHDLKWITEQIAPFDKVKLKASYAQAYKESCNRAECNERLRAYIGKIKAAYKR